MRPFRTLSLFLASISTSVLAAPFQNDTNMIDTGLFTLSASMAGTPLDPELFKVTDKLIFEVKMKEFLHARKHREPPDLIWDNDGCAHLPDKFLMWNFKHPCYRHNFALRNYVVQDRFDDANRKKLDIKYMKDLADECDKHPITMPFCQVAAIAYFARAKGRVSLGGSH